eukprot:scaffold396532_cov17-Prasinocladus_malaysianus.AAC.1
MGSAMRSCEYGQSVLGSQVTSHIRGGSHVTSAVCATYAVLVLLRVVAIRGPRHFAYSYSYRVAAFENSNERKWELIR